MGGLLKNLFILLLLVTFKASAQTNTPNIGFEKGTFDNWQCYTGSIDSLGNISVLPTPPVYMRQSIIGKSSATVLDPYGNFPILCPNGSNYSAMLGDSVTGAQAERITYTFTVPSISAYSIIFNYAVVLQNPNHLPYQQPKFTAQVFDVTDSTYINCPSFDFVASSDLPGFKLSNVVSARGASIYYKEWSTATIDLRHYLGKTVRLEFTANDCTRGAHFGYAYLDINENIGAAITGNAYCVGQKSMTLYAPNGFASYTWYNADLSKQLGTGQSLTISPPPPDMTNFALTISPYQGLGCVDTIYTIVNKIDNGFTLNVLGTVYGCPGTGVDLTAAAVTAGSSPGLTLSYFTDSLGTNYLYYPNMVTVPGLYYIQGINAEGCQNILPVRIILANPTINITNPQPVTYPATVDLSKTYIPQPGLTYSYYTDAGAANQLDNYTAIQSGGTYYIKAENKYGCDTVGPVKVVIYPPPPYTVTAPNVFTPNNDGINDHFILSITGLVSFGSVRIFNRYGQLVFTAKSLLDYWDGTFNGRNLPDGTYYWIFEGTDEYYHTKITRSSSITIVR